MFGVEGDIDWSSIGGQVTGPVMGIPATFQTQLSWLNTFRARVGYAFGPALPYVTGGGAFGGVRATNSITISDTGFVLGGLSNSQHALEMAQKLSHQLRAAEDRIAELQAEVGIYQDKAERAEQWLHKVYTEIEDRFLRQDNGRRGVPGAPQRTQSVRTSR